MSEVAVGAYFYPQSPMCGARLQRSYDVNAELGLQQHDIPNELTLVQSAQPLFEGHDQPKTYCLPIGEEQMTVWDDSYGMLFEQAAMAQNHGLSFFIFDSYNGLRNGQQQPEMYESNRIADRNMQWIGALAGFQFARMEALEGTRSILPIPMRSDLKRGFNGGFNEPARAFDVTPQAARFIVDANSGAWQNEAYIRVDGCRPYLSVMMPLLSEAETDQQKQDIVNTFIAEMRKYAQEAYGESPYIVGVTRQSSDVAKWAAAEVDAVTQYCALQEHGPDSLPVQQYPDLIAKREAEWPGYTRATAKKGIPFIPSVALGWDASPRGEQGYGLEEVAGLHPYTPIVVNNSPEFIGGALNRAIEYTAASVPKGQQYLPLFAWNEFGEGAAAVPRLRPDGTVDKSCLQAISRAIHQSGVCKLCASVPMHSGRPA